MFRHAVITGGHTACIIRLVGSAHQRSKLPFFIVIHEEFFRQRRLVIEHVNQKAQSAKVITQLIESVTCTRLLLVGFGGQHLPNTVTHV